MRRTKSLRNGSLKASSDQKKHKKNEKACLLWYCLIAKPNNTEGHAFSYDKYYIMDNTKNTPQYFP
jgi:hypothetical protein